MVDRKIIVPLLIPNTSEKANKLAGELSMENELIQDTPVINRYYIIEIQKQLCKMDKELENAFDLINKLKKEIEDIKK